MENVFDEKNKSIRVKSLNCKIQNSSSKHEMYTYKVYVGKIEKKKSNIYII